MEPSPRRLYPTPQAEANPCSRATFWWTNDIVSLSQKRHLAETDLYDIAPRDSSVSLVSDLGREWEKEIYKSKTGQKHGLGSALFRCYGHRIIGTGVIFFVVEGLRIAQAIFLGLIVTYFESGSRLPWQRAAIYAAFWILCYISVIFLDNLAFHISHYEGLKIKVACTSMIYRKLLRLNYKSLQTTSPDSLNCLLLTDTAKLEQCCAAVNYVWIAAVEAVAAAGVMWVYLDLRAVTVLALALLGVLGPAQFLVGRLLARLRSQVAGVTDRRVSTIREVISGIRSIKVSCWEKHFLTLVNSVRKSEWAYVRSLSHVRGLNSAAYHMSGKLLAFTTFTTLTLLGGRPTLATLFTSLALYDILRTSTGLLLPWGVQQFMEARAAIHRIQKYLLLEEKGLLETMGRSSGRLHSPTVPLEQDTAIRLTGFSAAWPEEESFKLEQVNLSVKKGEFVIITGPTSSGKTSLLLAMTGELPTLEGSVSSRGRVGLVTYRPWLVPGTIRDNILFGIEMDRRRYNKVLHACSLLQDLDNFDNGDLSHINEKGLQLTEQQKCKICLARAVYQNSDSYLVDDILADMDLKTATHIFNKCFCGLLSGKTLVFVSQNMKFLKAADNIIIMDQGMVAYSGSYDEIQNQGTELEKLVYSYHANTSSVSELNEDAVDDDDDTDHITTSQLPLVLRHRSGLDSTYGSTESLDQILLEHDLGCSDTDTRDEAPDHPPVRWGVYVDYLRRGGGILGLTLFCLLCVVTQVTFVLSDWWLYMWIKDQNNATSPTTNITSSLYPPPPSAKGGYTLFPFTPHVVEPVNSFYTYVGVFLSFIFLTFVRSFLFSIMANSVAKNLHNASVITLMRASLAALEKITPEKVLAKFSKDICCIDYMLPAGYFDCIQFMFLLLGTCVVTVVTNYWLVLVVLPMVIFFLCARFYFINTAREIKRLELQARDSMLQHVSSTLSGLWVLRALRCEGRLVRHLDMYVDRHTAATSLHLAVQRWFSLRLDLICAASAAFVVVVCLALSDMVDPGLMGLTLLYALSTMGLFQYSTRQAAELEQQMTSLAEVRSFTALPVESDPPTPRRPPAPTWPQYGIITFEGCTLTDSDGCRQLRNMWGCIRAEEKVGILSQSEGCKAGVVSSILRLLDLQKGVVRIDGLDISDIGLHDLRGKISLIPQDPVLFSGSLRRNLDPLTRYPDASVWRALEQVSLRSKVARLPGTLYADTCLDQFTLGERQLLGLARALLSGNKIVIFEEAVSALDKRSEAIIQYILSSKLSQKTVIVVAQRIQTVISMDRVMILEDGRINEFESAHVMMQNQLGYFNQLISSLLGREAARMRKLAKDKFENRPYCTPVQLQVVQADTRSYTGGSGSDRHFLPAFHNSRLTGVLSQFAANRFSTNRF